jgi:hypothetical protein
MFNFNRELFTASYVKSDSVEEVSMLGPRRDES